MKHASELAALAKFVRTIPASEFDMGYWIKRTPCGTVGCAIGWGVEKGVISGLKFRRLTMAINPIREYFPVIEDAPMVEWFDAVAFHFGITEPEAAHLFCSEKYEHPTREAVAARIEAFLAEHAPVDVIREMKPDAKPAAAPVA